MADRPSRLDVLVIQAQAQALRATCARLQVGAVIHREGRILTTGYNGAPAGTTHCDHGHCICIQSKWARNPERIDTTHTQNCLTHDLAACRAQHAERNAIDWAARHGIRLEGSELVTTDTPCAQCAGSIINAGIVSVIAVRAYRDPTGVGLLSQGGVSMSLYEDVR